MSRSTRTLLVFLLSLAVAGGASYLVYQRAQSVPVREVEVRSYQVVVAARALPMGTLLAASDLKLVPWPQSSPVAGSYSTMEEVVNRGLVAAVVENEPLTSGKVATKEAGAGLPPLITQGMRAISVKVDEVVGVAGFVVPGARVDVVVTLNQQQEGMARTVVENAQVLTAGTRIDQEQAKDGRPLPSTVVTLLVSPDNAERIALAGTVGRITLTLRNPLDQDPFDTKGTRVGALMGAPAPPPPAAVVFQPRRVRAERAAPPPPPSAPSVYMVETIRAAKRGAEEVK